MDDDNRSLVPVPDDSLANTAAGSKRILAEMVGETLALVHHKQTESRPAVKQQPIPEDKLEAFLKVAGAMLQAGVDSPEKLAEFAEKQAFGTKLRGYYQGLWDAMSMVRPELDGTHDWTKIAKDRDGEEAEGGGRTKIRIQDGEVFRLLIGNLDEPTADGHAQLVQIALGEKFAVKTNRFTYADELLQAAQGQTCDLCIVALNNLVFRDAGNELSQRVTNSLQLMARLRLAGAKLIIAVTGHIDAPDLPDRVRQAGADAFFFVLCTAGDFQRALYPPKSFGEFVNKGLELAGCRWCEPDYWQIALWAQELSTMREDVIQRLVKCGTILHRTFWRFISSDPGFAGELGEAVACAADFLRHGYKTPEQILHHFRISFPKGAEHRLQILCQNLGKTESRIKGLQQSSAERPGANHAYLRKICENLSKADSLTDEATDWKALAGLATYGVFVSEFQRQPDEGTPLHIRQLRLRSDFLPISHITFVSGLRIEALECEGDGFEVIDVRLLPKLETMTYDRSSTHLVKRDDQDF
jgi:hypothetical protein